MFSFPFAFKVLNTFINFFLLNFHLTQADLVLVLGSEIFPVPARQVVTFCSAQQTFWFVVLVLWFICNYNAVSNKRASLLVHVFKRVRLFAMKMLLAINARVY